MGDLLINPNGRIARNRFWQGMVILTVASVLVSAAVWLVNPLFDFLSLALIFPYICVYGKRLHDIGQSAWWVIAIWFAVVIIQVVLFLVLLFTIMPAMMSPEQKEIWQEVLRLSEKGDTNEAVRGFELLMEETQGLIQRMLLLVMVAANAIMAVIIGLIKTEPRENKHGPVPMDA
nr:DUF805 domain-containing protein [Hyphomonas sp. Mor2]